MQTLSDKQGHEDLTMTKRYLGIYFEDYQTTYDLCFLRQ